MIGLVHSGKFSNSENSDSDNVELQQGDIFVCFPGQRPIGEIPMTPPLSSIEILH